MTFVSNWGLFFAKSFSLIVLLLIFLALVLGLISKAKMKLRQGELELKPLDKEFSAQQISLWQHTLSKKEFKAKIKAYKKNLNKKKQKTKARLFIINFKGDLRAQEAENLSKEITAIIQCAEKEDEVLVQIESPGGMVPHYGYAASQLQRLREHNIKLTVAIDKVAASGGYLMACVAEKIIAAPFAIIGSIGVVAQIPNLHRWLAKHDIDFEQICAGEYKRTLTVFGKNTSEGREKLTEQVEEIHALFKSFIKEHRPEIDLARVATGEHWLAKDALALNLVDQLNTSDEYILSAFQQQRPLFAVKFVQKKSLSAKLNGNIKMWLQKLNGPSSLF
jgi:serine protease SohB